MEKHNNLNKNQNKSWNDSYPPDGHLPESYEIQVCDDGNKLIAIQMLNKSGINYKISVRNGQFFIQAEDMKVFTSIKHVLDQSIDMNKEFKKLGFKPETTPEITPVGSNTPQQKNNVF